LNQNNIGVHFLGSPSPSTQITSRSEANSTIIKKLDLSTRNKPIRPLFEQAFSQTVSNGGIPVQVMLRGSLAQKYQILQQNLFAAMKGHLPEKIRAAKEAYLDFRLRAANTINALEQGMEGHPRWIYTDIADLKPATVDSITSGE
jgi:hypothetical protein